MKLGQRSVERLNVLRQMEEQMNFSVRSATEDGQAYIIEEKQDGVEVRAEIEDFDKYSCRLKSLALTVDRTDSDPPARLHVQAKEVARTIHYLTEDLKLVELDPVTEAAQLRSSPPQKRQATTTYFELMLQSGNKASLRRYSQRKGETERQGVVMILTEETFERLTNDLAHILLD